MLENTYFTLAWDFFTNFALPLFIVSWLGGYVVHCMNEERAYRKWRSNVSAVK